MNSLASSSRQAVRAALAAGLALVLLLIPFAAAGNAAGSSQKVVSGTLTWGVKESFRSYLTGPIASGTITPSDGARADSQHVASFNNGTGNLMGGKGSISFKGKVRYYGHAGILDFTLIDPKLTIDPSGTGHLEFGYQVAKGSPKRITIADVDPAKLNMSGTQANLSNTNTHLTKAGMEVFSYQGHPFYPENTQLDPVTAALTLNTPATSTPSSSTSPTTAKPSPSTSTPTTVKPAPSATPSAPAATPPTSSPSTSAASLTWGVKDSFRSYIAGPIANGRITVSGHATATPAGFTFPQTGTTAKLPNASGTTSYGGSVNFYGHGGILNLTFTNPRVIIPGSGKTGQLLVDYTENGKGVSGLPIATLNFAGGQESTSGSSMTYRNVPAALTDKGTVAFSYQGHGFYPAGIALDPVTFTIGSNTKVSGSGDSSVVTNTVNTPTSSGSNGSGNSTGISSGIATPATAPATKQGAGSLVWGVRNSFDSYILGPIANGSITVSGGASAAGSAWVFPQNGAKTSDGGAPYRGSVKFYGHGGILNLTFSNPVIHISSANSAELSTEVNGKRTSMVTLNLSKASKSTNSGSMTYTGAPATLTSAGSQVFSYQGHAFYPTGSPMDPVTFTVGTPSSENAKTSTVTGTSAGAPGSAKPSQDTSSNGSNKPAVSNLTCPATGTDITWGFKESFRSYIDGSIANGDWTTKDGATYTTPNFIWTKGSGKFSKDGTQGLVKFPGSVHFTGHDGALDTTIANPTLEFTGDHTYLRLDAKSTLMDAALKGKTQWVERDNSRFVELDTSRISVTKKGSKSVISGQNVPTKLTGDGAVAFPNYTAGTAMDPMTFELTTGSNCATAKSASSAKASPKPSASHPSVPTQAASASQDHGTNMAPWVGAGALGLLAVGGAAAVARRRAAGASTNNSHTPEDAE